VADAAKAGALAAGREACAEAGGAAAAISGCSDRARAMRQVFKRVSGTSTRRVD
jgi:hypothetical protein